MYVEVKEMKKMEDAMVEERTFIVTQRKPIFRKEDSVLRANIFQNMNLEKNFL